ncbi:hypothetical protein BH10CYA1_BH10CYA1_10630 [soil metagenome]
MSINWNNHIDRLRSQIADLRSTLRVIKTKAHDERPGLEQTTAQLRELVDKDESQKTLYQFPKILHKILHNPAVGAIILGPNGEHLLFNTAAERLLGSDLMADALAEKSGNFGFYLTDKVTKYTKVQLPWQQAVLGEQVPEVDLFVRRQGYVDGLWIKATSTALKSETNDIGGAVVFIVDITEQVQVENQIQSTCEALEQQISQIGIAQLELQLLTEKLGKLDYLSEATPDAVPVQIAESTQKTADSKPSVSEVASTKVAAKQTSELISDLISELIPESSPQPESPATSNSQAASIAPATQDSSSVIDYASDELASWADIEPVEESAEKKSSEVTAEGELSKEKSTDQINSELKSSQDRSSQQTENSDNTTEEAVPDQAKSYAGSADQVEEDFAAYEARLEQTLIAQGDAIAAHATAETPETLEAKAQKVNESIVKKLTSEIFAIANQVTLEPIADTKPDQQEFFAPDSSEKQPMAQVTETAVETDKLQHKTSKKSSQKPTEAVEPAQSKRRKILIVDDIPVNQKLLRLQLKRLGFECDAANNGDAAQKAIANGDFALVLMDLDMPVMDGFESTAAIRKSEQGLGKRIPIVAMTSYDRQEDRERCLAAGMDDFLSKGATQKQLHEVVERCMRAASTETTKAPPLPTEPLKETGLDIESLQKQFDKEEVQDVSRLFLSAVNTFIDCIQLGIEEKDAGAVTHFAHSVKGPCAALGIDEMTRLTSEIMSDAEAGNWTQVRVKYMKLKSSFGEVRDQLRELCTPGYV